MLIIFVEWNDVSLLLFEFCWYVVVVDGSVVVVVLLAQMSVYWNIGFFFELSKCGLFRAANCLRFVWMLDLLSPFLMRFDETRLGVLMKLLGWISFIKSNGNIEITLTILPFIRHPNTTIVIDLSKLLFTFTSLNSKSIWTEWKANLLDSIDCDCERCAELGDIFLLILWGYHILRFFFNLSRLGKKMCRKYLRCQSTHSLCLLKIIKISWFI